MFRNKSLIFILLIIILVSSINIYNKSNHSKIFSLENINIFTTNSRIIAFTIIPVEHLSFRF